MEKIETSIKTSCKNEQLRINAERLEQMLFSLSRIGRNPQGGIDRSLGTEAEKEARDFLVSYWKETLHLSVRTDPIANLWAVLPNSSGLAPIMLGSHHDTVPNGGMYDGALGVLLATEIVQTLKENHVRLRHPIGILSFTGEEPNAFQVSTLGSKVICGRLRSDDLRSVRNNETGAPLSETISALGGDIEKTSDALLNKSKVAAFIECHVEQGKRLESRSLSIANVSCITGIYRETLHIIGEANHAGTTMLRDRKDALLAACEIDLALEKRIKEAASDSVSGTIGAIHVFPNAANIIPGIVDLTIDIRICDLETKQKLIKGLNDSIHQIESNRGVRVERKVILDQAPTPLSPKIQQVLKRACKQVGQPETTLVSMAGHDSANMQRVTDVGMLFVQSVAGKSHCPEEYTRLEDIKVAASALLQAVLILDKELD